MKYRLIISSILLSVFSHLFSQTLEELEKKIAEENHISKKIQYDHKYIKGKPSSTGVKTISKSYSPQGELLEENTFNNKGEVIGWEKYEYDYNGNRTLYERENTNSKYKKASKYDDSDKLLMEAGFNGAENFRNEYEYTADGKVSKITYMSGNRIVQKITYIYSGSSASVEIYGGGNMLASKMELKYDAHGNVIEEKKLDVNGTELEKKIFEYDASGNILKEVKTRKGNFEYSLMYTYDSANRLLRIAEETIAKKKYDKKVYTYDVNGNLTEYKWRRNPDDEFNIKKFTYDPKGVCLTEYTFYPQTKYEVLSKFEYEFH
jgi:hypothetical protein